MSGACEFEIKYADRSYLTARTYSGVLSFPSSTLPSTAASISNYYFGCAFKSSPRFFSAYNALFGIDWQPMSLWRQMQTAGLVGSTMSLCLGNGGDATETDQTGVVIFGSPESITIGGGSARISETINISMVNVTGNPSLEELLFPPTMWIRLNKLSISDKFSASLTLSMRPTYYIVDR